MTDKLYGNPGIDTPYERKKFEYRPKIEYPEKTSTFSISVSTLIQIERAREFTISNAIRDYQELIDRLEEFMKTLEDRNKTDAFASLIVQLKAKKLKEITRIEDENSLISQTGDFELYTMLFRMKDSLYVRVDFLQDKFTAQFTDETDIDKIEEIENQSITEWLNTENLFDSFFAGHDHDDVEETARLELESLALEKKKRDMELLHSTLADTSFMHKNRYEFFKGAIDTAEVLIYQANRLVEGNMEFMISSLSVMPDLSAAKAQLLLNFKEVRNKHTALKGQYLMIDDGKETFINEKNYLFQQIKIKSEEPVRQWLYEQEEDVSESLDLFGQLMVDGIKNTKKQYDSCIGGVLQFYKNEAYFYNEQITVLQKKEEIRRFYRIIEDLGEVGEVTDEWVSEYLQVNGYRSSGDV